MPNKILALDKLISKYTSYITIFLFVITSYYKVVVFIDPLQGLHNY